MRNRVAIKTAIEKKDWGAITASEVKEFGSAEEQIEFRYFQRLDRSERKKLLQSETESEKLDLPTFRRNRTKKRIPQSFSIYKMTETRNIQLEKRKFYGYHDDLHFRQTPLNLFLSLKKGENPESDFRTLLAQSKNWRTSENADDLIREADRLRQLYDIENKHATRKAVLAKDWIAIKVRNTQELQATTISPKRPSIRPIRPPFFLYYVF